MPSGKKDRPIGKRLMKLRKEKKLTLKHIGNETGLNPRFISQVEKGEVMPPVSVILQLSRALEVDSSLLLREEKKRAGEKKAESYQKRTEDYSYETLTPEARHKHLKAFKILIDPKSEHKPVGYQHLSCQLSVFSSGSFLKFEDFVVGKRFSGLCADLYKHLQDIIDMLLLITDN